MKSLVRPCLRTASLALVAWLYLLSGAASLAAPGTLITWGGGQTNTPAALEDIVALSVSMDHSLAVRSDGTVLAWGNNFDGQCDVPAGLANVKAVAAGAFFSVALKQDGTVVAWGDNQWGQCRVPGNLRDVVAVSAGRAHTLALRQDGSVVAWGSDIYNQCNVPPGASNARQVLAEWNYSAVLRQDGTVLAWGVNDAGQTEVPPGLTNVVFIDGAESYCLAVKADGSIAAWGRGPLTPDWAGSILTVAAGDTHVLALKSDRTVIGWGSNQGGQLDVPGGLSNVEALSAGWNYSAAIRARPGAAPLRLKDPVRTQGSFSLSISTEAGLGYTLEFNDALQETGWVAFPRVVGTGGEVWLTDPSPVTAQRFYRVRRD